MSLAVGVHADVLGLAALLCPPATVSLTSYGSVLAELPVTALQHAGSALPAVQGHPLLNVLCCLQICSILSAVLIPPPQHT